MRDIEDGLVGFMISVWVHYGFDVGAGSPRPILGERTSPLRNYFKAFTICVTLYFIISIYVPAGAPSVSDSKCKLVITLTPVLLAIFRGSAVLSDASQNIAGAPHAF